MQIPKIKIPGLDLGQADLEKYLEGLNFPASRQDIIDHARKANAPDPLVDALNKIPDKTYDSGKDVVQSVTS